MSFKASFLHKRKLLKSCPRKMLDIFLSNCLVLSLNDKTYVKLLLGMWLYFL